VKKWKWPAALAPGGHCHLADLDSTLDGDWTTGATGLGTQSCASVRGRAPRPTARGVLRGSSTPLSAAQALGKKLLSEFLRNRPTNAQKKEES
jgi:hypothetical protein